MTHTNSPSPSDILAAREAAGLTQAQAAACAGRTSAATWRTWENGRRAMCPYKFARFKEEAEFLRGARHHADMSQLLSQVAALEAMIFAKKEAYRAS